MHACMHVCTRTVTYVCTHAVHTLNTHTDIHKEKYICSTINWLNVKLSLLIVASNCCTTYNYREIANFTPINPTFANENHCQYFPLHGYYAKNYTSTTNSSPLVRCLHNLTTSYLTLHIKAVILWYTNYALTFIIN